MELEINFQKLLISAEISRIRKGRHVSPKADHSKNRFMYSQRSFSLFGDYPSRPADQSQGLVINF